MQVENKVYPEGGQIAALAALGGEAPIVMVNLLKFRAVAAYDDPAEPPVSGREAYMRYGEAMVALVEAAGGRMLFQARVDALVIGAVENLWDVAALVEYPSRAAFIAIATSPEVNAIGRHRQAGLEGQLLIQCSQGTPLGG